MSTITAKRAKNSIVVKTKGSRTLSKRYLRTPPSVAVAYGGEIESALLDCAKSAETPTLSARG
jgi:hypothetical protein